MLKALFAACLLPVCISFNAAAKEQSYTLELGAGAVAGSIPAYPGAEESYDFLLPFPYIYYKDESLTIDRQAITDKFFGNQYFDLSLTASGSIPVDSDRTQARKGMPDLGWVGELGPAINLYPRDDLKVSFLLRKATALHDGNIDNAGWRGDWRLTWYAINDVPLKSGTLNLEVQAQLSYADARYHDYFYGVDPVYATPDRAAFTGISGHHGMVTSVGLTFQTKKFWLGTFARYHDLSSAANSDSPLFKDKYQLSAGIAAAWIIWSNK